MKQANAANSIRLVSKSSITVVIPTLNEEASIVAVINEVRQSGYENILVVDGYSKDKTRELAMREGARLINQVGKGKGGAIRAAIQSVDTEFLVVMDGDMSYSAGDIDKFLPLLTRCDYVQGARSWHENMSKTHRLGNYLITKSFNLLFGSSLQDVCSGLYVLRASHARGMDFERHHFSVEQEIAAQMVMEGKVEVVPIAYRKRLGGASNVRTWRQGFTDLATNFQLARAYNPILLLSFLASLALVPAGGIFVYFVLTFLLTGVIHSTYLLVSIVLLILGVQGLTVSTIAVLIRRLERKLGRQVA